jgi:hypothetical protein
MQNVTFHKNSDKLVQVKINGRHAGWLDRGTHKKDGMTGSRSRYHFWAGLINGVNVRATSLTSAKAKINSLG